MSTFFDADGLKLIECQFALNHWFEVVVKVFHPDEHTISRIHSPRADLVHD